MLILRKTSHIAKVIRDLWDMLQYIASVSLDEERMRHEENEKSSRTD